MKVELAIMSCRLIIESETERERERELIINDFNKELMTSKDCKQRSATDCS